MSWNDPNFPKNRGGFSGLGRAKVGELDRIDVPYLRRRVPGAQAIKKGEFLYVVKDSQELADPYLWSTYEVRFGDAVVLAGIPTAVDVRQVPKLKPWAYQVHPPIVSPFWDRPFWFSVQTYVGDDYAIRLSYFDPVAPLDPPTLTARSVAYLTNVRYRTEVLLAPSLSTDNVPPNDVTFGDVTPLLAAANASIFASGWDAAAEGYGFGHVAFLRSGDPLTSKAMCYRGSTATRQMTPALVLEGSAAGGFSPAYAVGSGHVLGYSVGANRQQDVAPPAVPSFFFRSRDHGRAWAYQPAAELQPYMFKFQYSGVDPLLVKYENPERRERCFVASPIGEGRVAIVVLCAKEAGRTYTLAESQASDPYLATLTCWKFFVSEANGENFTNHPWPLDAHDGSRLLQRSYESAGSLDRHGLVNWNGLHPAVEFADTQLMGTPLSAGPGSFFMSVGEMVGVEPIDTNSPPVFDQRRVRMLFTVDYGTTWTLTDVLPAEVVPEPSVITNAAGTSSFGIMRFAVVRPYVSPENRGLLFCQVVKAAGHFVYRTDATFSSFTLASSQDFAGGVFEESGGTPPGYASPPVYIGNKQPSRRFRPLVRTGYPEFEKPA